MFNWLHYKFWMNCEAVFDKKKEISIKVKSEDLGFSGLKILRDYKIL